jgi:hypothetical protein
MAVQDACALKKLQGETKWSIAMRQIGLRKVAIAAFACASAVLLSWNWSEQSGVSLSVDSAQAAVGRISYYAAGYYATGHRGFYSGVWYQDWDNYAAVNGIKCRPGTLIKFSDGLTYVCQ